MSSIICNKIKVSVFGESHGEAIGCVIDGLPAGIKLDLEKIYKDMARRAPGKDKTATPRLEKDIPHILSGVLNNITTGAPLSMIIENTNAKSTDYENIMKVPRPSHSDYPAYVKYDGYNDIRGGGHFSGRLTAPIVFAGAIAKSEGCMHESIVKALFAPTPLTDRSNSNILNSSWVLKPYILTSSSLTL